MIECDPSKVMSYNYSNGFFKVLCKSTKIWWRNTKFAMVWCDV